MYKNIIIFILFAEILFLLLVFYPGHMSIDSLSQLNQAINNQYSDHHPPFMAILWSFLNQYFDGPQGLLYTHLLILFVSLLTLFIFYEKNKYSWLLLILPLLPWVMNFAGVIWKDVGMAFSLLLFFSLSLKKTKSNKLFYLQLIIVYMLFFYAINIRHNAIFAAIPLLLFAFNNLFPKLTKLKIIIFSFLLIFITFVLGNFIKYDIFKVEKSYSIRGMTMLDDLFYLSLLEKKSMIPGISFSDINICSDYSTAGSIIHLKDFCLKDTESYKKNNPYKNPEIEKAWYENLQNHFFVLFEYKFNTFLHLLRLPNKDPFYIWQEKLDISPEPNFYQKINNDYLTNITKQYVNFTSIILPIVFKPYFWLLLNLILLCVTQIRKSNIHPSTVLIISSTFYIVGYFPLNVSIDFRYAYWSVIATSLAIIIFIINKKY